MFGTEIKTKFKDLLRTIEEKITEETATKGAVIE